MRNGSLATLLGAMALAPLAVPGNGMAQVGPITYGIPTPPAISYAVSDTMLITLEGGPLGNMTMTMHLQMRLDLEFAADPDGLRVTGIVAIEDGGMSSDLMGDMPFPGEALGEQTIEFVMNERGEVQALSFPELAALTGLDFGPTNDLTSNLFPRWPEHAIQPGDTWVDTVEVSPEMDFGEPGAAMQATTITISSYTFVGETNVDAGDVLHFAVEGETVADMAMELEGDEMNTMMTASVSGYHLWDADRGVVVQTMTTTNLDGTMEMPGLGAMAMSSVQTHHMRLIN